MLYICDHAHNCLRGFNKVSECECECECFMASSWKANTVRISLPGQHLKTACGQDWETMVERRGSRPKVIWVSLKKNYTTFCGAITRCKNAQGRGLIVRLGSTCQMPHAQDTDSYTPLSFSASLSLSLAYRIELTIVSHWFPRNQMQRLSQRAL